jgi:ankyrin repeat protein
MAPTSTPMGTVADPALSRELRDELESLFEQSRSNLFEWFEEVEILDERFLLLVSRYPEEVLRGAVLMTALETPDISFSGRLPIHLACDNNAPIGVIRRLLESDTDKISILKPDKWGDLPIHTACSRTHFLEVIKLLLMYDVDKHTIFVKDENGSLPIHMACRYNADAEVIQLLLESDAKRTSLYAEGVYGQLPLHVACRGGASPEIIQTLLDYDNKKMSVLKEDNVGRLPIHLYILANKNVNRNMDIVRLLLEGMFCNRIESVGLELWKQTMNQLLDSLNKSYERDSITRDGLDSICVEIKELMHRSFLLELAIWKASCLRSLDGGRVTFQCLQDIDDWEKTDKNFDACQYRQEMLHLSGADQIIPHVLPFVDDEAIIKLMEELK